MEFKDIDTGQNNSYNEANLGEKSQYIGRVDTLNIVSGDNIASPAGKSADQPDDDIKGKYCFFYNKLSCF